MPDKEGTTRRPETIMAVETSPRPKKRPKDLMDGKAVESGNRAADRAAREGGYAKGGMVRGCKSGQMSGKGFSGTY
jgi:hypothetical protein